MGNSTNGCAAQTILGTLLLPRVFTALSLCWTFVLQWCCACLCDLHLTLWRCTGAELSFQRKCCRAPGFDLGRGCLANTAGPDMPHHQPPFHIYYKEGDPVGCLPIHSFQFRALDRQESLQFIFQGSVVVQLQFNLHLDTLQFVPRCFSRLSENSP